MKKINLQAIAEELQRQIKFNRIIQVRKIVKKYDYVDLAEALELVEKEQMVKIIRALDSETSAAVFTYLISSSQQYVIETFSSIEIREILKEMYSDDIVEILDELPANITKKILASSNKEIRNEINQILKYDENTAGSIMMVNYIELDMNLTLKTALEKIKLAINDVENTDIFYVIDDKRKLVGKISLKDIVFNESNLTISQVMDSRLVFVQTHEDQQQVVQIIKRYDIHQIPVVNKQQRLVGIVTVDGIVDIIEEETTEDIHKMVGISSPSEKSYFETSIWKMIRSRIPWLLILMISATLTQLVIYGFMKFYQSNDVDIQSTSKITSILSTLLIPLLPIISGTCGNAGSQSSVMVVRGLSLGEINQKQFAKVLWKELQVATIVGIILVIVNFIRMCIIDVIINKQAYINKEQWYSILILSISLYITLVVAKTIGGLLPFLAKIIKIDPAVMAAPLLTTVVDVLSAAVFFSISLIFFGNYVGL